MAKKSTYKTATKPAANVTMEDRQRMIEEAAYYRAEKAGFTGDPADHWQAAVQDVEARLKGKK